MPEVSCTVNTCKYWENDNLCNASRIVIQSDAGGGFPPSASVDKLDKTPAESKDETCCQTFRNEGHTTMK